MFYLPFFIQTPAVDSQSPSLTDKSEEDAITRRAAEHKPSEQEKPAVKTPEILPSLPQSSEGIKKPAGAVSLFGGIDILASKQTKSPLDEADDDDGFLAKDTLPPNMKKEETKKEEKVKTNTVSLFDDEEEDESDWNDPIFTPSKPTAKNTLKVCMIIVSLLHCLSCIQDIKICVPVLF